MNESRITKTATTLTIGSWLGRDRLVRIQIGSVWSGPAVNVVTMTSSNDSANASSAPASSALRSAGNVTKANVCHVDAPRSADASSNEPDTRRSQATRSEEHTSELQSR